MPIRVEKGRDPITTVVIDNPVRRNALDETMYRHLARLWPELARSPAACVVLTGAGGAFCSGADLSAGLIDMPDVDELVDVALLKSMFFPKPLIAAIDGACVAGGFELALACDIRLCSPTARFGLPEPRWGIFPSGGGARKLAGEIGHARASELLLTGRLFDADEALAMGLVSRVIGSDDLLEAAYEVAERIAANSPTATRSLKRYLHASETPSPALIALERELTIATRRADTAEGSAAFLAKRVPRYDQAGWREDAV